MPSPAVQTPFHPTASKREGRRIYRKQILPVGTVTHPDHGTAWEFTPDVMREMVETFDAGAMTQVPFVLCDEKNRHTDDPERFRGEVKGLEAKADGLYALVELTERGASLLEDNPTQPVSVRMLTPRAGKFAGRAVLGHVAATLDEVAKGMHPWERIEASSEAEVVDLSDGTLTLADAGHGRPAGDMADTETPTLTKDDQGWLDKLRSTFKAPPKDGEPEPGKEPKEPTAEEAAEAQRLLDEVLPPAAEPDAEPAKPKEGERELEPATLSDKDRETVDLARSDAATARKEAAESRVELANERFGREADQMRRKGVPKHDIELARPLLENGDPEAIELSNGSKVDAAKIVRELLKAREGTIDFSELGAAEASDDDVVADQRRKDADAAAEGWV